MQYLLTTEEYDALMVKEHHEHYMDKEKGESKTHDRFTPERKSRFRM